MARTARHPPLGMALDETAPEPLHRQLYGQIRTAILAGRLPPGAQLPSSRLLAAELGCARGTVLLAVDQLTAEGYVRSAGGSGTFVADELPDDLLSVRRAAAGRSGGAAPARLRLSRRAEALLALAARPVAAAMGAPFAPGQPAIEHFPVELWARLLEQAWRLAEPGLLLASHPSGHPRLRTAIADYLRATRGLDCRPEEVVVTGGTQHAINLVARLVLDPGDPVWLEEPCYPGLRATLLAAGAATVPVPVDREGLSVARGRALAPLARLAVATPSHQYPLGTVMSLPRRLELLRWAAEAEAWIVEDDYDSEYRYRGRPLEPLRLLDGAGRVIYVGTFSKVLFPTLRLGYLVAPPALAEAIGKSLTALEPVAAMVAQTALARFIAEGHFAVHLRRMRHLYAARQGALIEAARLHLAGSLALEPRRLGRRHRDAAVAPLRDPFGRTKRPDVRLYRRRAGADGAGARDAGADPARRAGLRGKLIGCGLTRSGIPATLLRATHRYT
jgi:GntR family transcriptional regulator/MocR family aminotransferase